MAAVRVRSPLVALPRRARWAVTARRHASTSSSPSCSSSPARRNSSSLPPIYYSCIPHYVPYALGLALQERLYSLRGQPEFLLLLEHTPVYTEGRRGHRSENNADAAISDTAAAANMTEEELRARFKSIGADYHLTQRGGLITYHGPGQLIGYPILNLGSMGLSSRCYIDRLQLAIRNLISRWGLKAVEPPENHTGVWSSEDLKICSIGVQVRHRITTHGFGLNVTGDVRPWFARIVACGIKGKSMTWMQAELEEEGGKEKVTVKEVMPKAVEAVGAALDRQLLHAGEDLLRYEAGEGNVLKRVWVKGEEVKVGEEGGAAAVETSR